MTLEAPPLKPPLPNSLQFQPLSATAFPSFHRRRKTASPLHISSFAGRNTEFRKLPTVSAVLEAQKDSAAPAAVPSEPFPVRIIAIVGEGSVSPLKSASWEEVMLHTVLSLVLHNFLTPNGDYPNDLGSQRLVSALDKCGIKEWELFTVDNCSCRDPPLELPEGSGLHSKVFVKDLFKSSTCGCSTGEEFC